MPQTLGQLNGLPEVVFRLAWRFNLLEPLMGATLGIAEHPFLLHPGCRGEYHIGQFSGAGRVNVGHDHKAAVTLSCSLAVPIEVGQRLERVGDLNPDDLDIPPVKGSEHLRSVIGRFGRNLARVNTPDFGRLFPVLGVGDNHICRQAVGEGAHLAGSTAGRGLAGQRHGIFTWATDLAGQQV